LYFWIERSIINNMSQLAGIAWPYLKDRTRAGLRENTVLESIELSYNGDRTQASRIIVTALRRQFQCKQNAGYERSKLTFIISDTVLGKLVDMTSAYESALPGAPRLEERTTSSGHKLTHDASCNNLAGPYLFFDFGDNLTFRARCRRGRQ
jgi:hypothetical protein